VRSQDHKVVKMSSILWQDYQFISSHKYLPCYIFIYWYWQSKSTSFKLSIPSVCCYYSVVLCSCCYYPFLRKSPKRTDAFRDGTGGDNWSTKHGVQSGQIAFFHKDTISEIIVNWKRILCVSSGRSVFSEFLGDWGNTPYGKTVRCHAESKQIYRKYLVFFI